MFGLYPAGTDWVRTFAAEKLSTREIQRALVEHASFTAAIAHQPFGEHRGAVVAQFGHMLLLSATTPGANNLVVTATVEMQHLLWSYREGYATQWSDREIRSVTGYSGWGELLNGARREFSRACQFVEAAIAGTLAAPRLEQPERRSTVHEPISASFPNEDDDAFYQEMASLSQVMEVPSCAL